MGRTLGNGRYLKDAKLGEGTFGAVYKAHDTKVSCEDSQQVGRRVGSLRSLWGRFPTGRLTRWLSGCRGRKGRLVALLGQTPHRAPHSFTLPALRWICCASSAPPQPHCRGVPPKPD